MNVTYSGNGKRLGAYLLDGLIGGIVCGIAGVIGVGMASGTGDFMAMLSGGFIALNIAYFLYSVLFECGKKHATPGKRITGIKIAGKDGSEAKTLDILVRNTIKILPFLLVSIFIESDGVTSICGLVELIYYITPFCNKNHRAIHDFIAGTAVVTADSVAADESMGADAYAGVNGYTGTDSYNTGAGANSYAGPATSENGVPSFEVPVVGAGFGAPMNGAALDNATFGNAPTDAGMGQFQTESQEEKTVKPFHAEEEEEKTVPPEFMKKTRKLVGVSGVYKGAELPLDRPIVMGREQTGCNLHFPESTGGVSRMHCKVTVAGEYVRLEDLGSTYGILVNQSRRLGRGEWMQLSVGDIFTIGKEETFVVK